MQEVLERKSIKNIDFNCDLAQSYGMYKNNVEFELLDYVSSVNISCGFHAGDPVAIKEALLKAKEKNVAVGAHIGFNEPSSSFASRTRIKALAPQTIKDNARFFGGDESKVPQQAITMGIGTIMESKMCILLAFGESKADAVAACVEGGMSILYPASILQMHPNAKIIVDEVAASKLKLADYYKWAFSKKPEWQMYK